MDTTAQAPQGALDVSGTDPAPAITSMDEPSNDADARRRSEDNILRWMRYLPADCINRMIEMGWDVST